MSFIEILQGFIVILIILISIIVYYKSGNYGEAGLALMAGLLAAFTVDWTWNRYIVFMAALLGFLLFIMLIGSIKIAAQIEDIYLRAAISIDINRSKDIAKQLKELADGTPTKKIGPIDKANAIQTMAFRKIPMTSMGQMLKRLDILSGITDLDPKYVTLFLIALSDSFNIAPSPGYENRVDKLFNLYLEAPCSYGDIIRAFMNSGRLVNFGKIEGTRYLILLKEALESHVPPEETYDYIKERIKES